MYMRVIILFFITGLFFLTSCNTSSNSGKNEKAIADIKTENTDLSTVQANLSEKYWKLIELNGKILTSLQSLNKEPHLLFKKEDHTISGNGGCNSFFGNYEIKEQGRITFTQIGATEMACDNMEVEMQLFQVLNSTDNYYLQGDTLVLNKAKMATLAKFVYLPIK